MIVSEEKKKILERIMNELPNTLLVGKRGTGKGTFMDILLNSVDCECIKINASDENSVDDVRDKIKNFATSFSPSRKIVYLNEADFLSPAAQGALRDLIESVEHMTSFFFLANNENKITEPIESRCPFQLNLNDPPGTQIFERCAYILKQENVKLGSKKELVGLIKKVYPDIRKIIGTLWMNASEGKIGKITVSANEEIYENIFNWMKDSDVEKVRQSLRSNYVDYSELYEHIYKKIMDDPDAVKSPGDMIVEVGEHLYRDASVAIKEVNFMAFFFKAMREGLL